MRLESRLPPETARKLLFQARRRCGAGPRGWRGFRGRKGSRRIHWPIFHRIPASRADLVKAIPTRSDGRLDRRVRKELQLGEINPPIWRRLHQRSDSSIATLHELLQIAFDWSDFHLHRFLIRGKEYGLSRTGCITFRTDARKVLLCQFRFLPSSTLPGVLATSNRYSPVSIRAGARSRWNQHRESCLARNIPVVQFGRSS
jgi:hypothetical protein